MVITTSDSNSTLVSLGNNRKQLNNNVGLKRVSSLEVLRSSPTTQSYDFEPSALLAPLDDDDDCFSTFEEMGSDYSCGSDESSFYNCYDPSFEQHQQQPIYLPSSSCSNADLGVDECLKCIPQIMERCDELLAVEPVRYTKKSPESILHVGQGEVAHAVPSQCDVIMSDKATTCHILALRSTTTTTTTTGAYSADSEPLVSLCHIDSTHYEECIRSMFARHAAHNNTMKQDTTTTTIRMDVHLVGGFNDSKGASREISNWLVFLLADLAAQHKKDSNMQVTLQTCAISSMNESGHESPIGRGLAVHLQSGQTFLASCDEQVAGPGACLRAVRLWCPSSTGMKTLSCIHDEHSKNGTIEITPFDFKPFPEIDRLLALPDHVMIQYCSTSPNCEEDDFCTSLRRTLNFLRTITPQQVFGKDGTQARVYQRIIIQKNKQHVFASSSSSTNYSNTWKLAAAYP